MYVCLCNAFRETELREAVGRGAGTVAQAYAALGGAPRCGRCLGFAKEIIEAARAGMSPPADAAPSVCEAPRDGTPLPSPEPG